MNFNKSPAHENEQDKNRKQFAIRLNIFFFITFIVFSIIVVRLAIIQFVEGPELRKVAEGDIVKEVPLLPTRGTIYDSSMQPIAYSEPTQSLYLTLDKDYNRSDRTQEAKQLARKLQKIFDQYGDSNTKALTTVDIFKAMDTTYAKANGYTPRRIKTGLSNKEIAYFLERRNEFKGIEIVEENIRHYDTDTVAVQTVGYLRPFVSSMSRNKYKNIQRNSSEDPAMKYSAIENVGFDGLELLYQDELRGKSGYRRVPINPKNMASGPTELIPPVKGSDLVLTINKEIQVATEKAITEHTAKIRYSGTRGVSAPNAVTGYAVAMEIDTGKVVTMASMPDYDSNIWSKDTRTESEWKNIEPYYMNGAIRSVNRPGGGDHPSSVVLLGSTMKPLSVLIGLNEQLFTLGDRYNDHGITTLGKEGYGTKVRNASSRAYGTLSPIGAISHSSNTFMVDMVGKRLYQKYEGKPGVEVWDKYMEQFGLGVSTESGLAAEYIGYKEYIHEMESGSAQSALAYASFGQQGKYTTLQLAQYTAMLANRGERLKPQFVNEIRNADGKVTKKFKKEVLNKVDLPSQYWDAVQSGMQSEVDAFKGFPYDYRRKTGTSQQRMATGKTIENAVFIAYAPAQNPKLAVAVVVPEGGYGAQGAAPIARQIFEAYDQQYGLDGIPKKKPIVEASGEIDSPIR